MYRLYRANKEYKRQSIYAVLGNGKSSLAGRTITVGLRGMLVNAMRFHVQYIRAFIMFESK